MAYVTQTKAAVTKAQGDPTRPVGSATPLVVWPLELVAAMPSSSKQADLDVLNEINKSFLVSKQIHVSRVELH